MTQTSCKSTTEAPVSHDSEVVRLPPHLQSELDEALTEANLEDGISLDEMLAELRRP